MENKELTAKQNAFCREYLKDSNGTQAAIRAGYAASSAKVTASKLLTIPNILKKIKTAQAATAQKAEIEKVEVLSFLKKMLELDPLDLMENKDIEGVTQLTLKDLQSIPKEVRALLEGIKSNKSGVEIKWPSKIKVIEVINKMLGFYDVHNEQKTGSLRPLSHLSDDDLIAIMKKKRNEADEVMSHLSEPALDVYINELESKFDYLEETRKPHKTS